MKKIILLAGLLFCGATQAQGLVFTTTGGAEITQNQVFTFSTQGVDAKVPLWVENTGTETIHFKIRVDEITNNIEGGNTAGELQLCFQPLCFFNITEGNTYPNNEITLDPGETNNIDDHFFSANDGNGGTVTYKFTFIQVDQDENHIADLRSFTYQYIPTMGISDLTSLTDMGITVNNTIVKDALSINASQPATMDVYALDGKLLHSTTIAEGSQSVDLSGLSAAIYIAKFTNRDNQSSTIRVVKN
jgi:hypothetical protein